jgi:hypothetical protein
VFTYDLTTPSGRVRLYIHDNVEADAHFSDEELAVFLESDLLSSYTGDRKILIASGMALTVWATALVQEDELVRTGAWTGDRRDVVGKMRKLAQSLFELAGYSPGVAPAFLSVPVDFSPFAAAERQIRER